MSQDGKLDAANTIVGELTDALAVSPTIADKVRFAVVDFSDDSQVVLPLCDLVHGVPSRGRSRCAAGRPTWPPSGCCAR